MKTQYLDATIEVLNPIGTLDQMVVAPAPRPTNLNNKRIYLYWNMKVNGDVALQRVGELLSERFTGVEWKIFPRDVTQPLAQEELDELRAWKPDVVVSSTGD